MCTLVYTNKQIVYCQSRPNIRVYISIYKQTNNLLSITTPTEELYIISTNLDTMIRLIYMISILIIYMYTSYIYIYMGNRLLVYEYNNHKDDRLIIQEYHMSYNTFTYYPSRHNNVETTLKIGCYVEQPKFNVVSTLQFLR